MNKMVDNKEVTLPGIIYRDIKEYLKEKKAIKQRKKIENRKIKFREIFVENCKKGYHAILFKYYAKKEKNIIKQQSKLESVQAKKQDEAEKYAAHDETVKVMQEIRAEQKAAQKAQEELENLKSENPEIEGPVVVEEAPVVAEPIVSEETPVVAEPIVAEEAPVVAEPLVTEDLNRGELEQRFVNALTEAQVQKTTQEVQENLAAEVQTITNNSTVAEEAPAVEETVVAEEVPTAAEPVVAEVAPAVVEPIVSEVAPAVVEPIASEVAPVVEVQITNNGTEEVNALLREIEGLGNYVAQLQNSVVKKLASKQGELNNVTKERDAAVAANEKLASERDVAVAENEKNVHLYNSMLVNKDQDIENLKAQLEAERAARIQAETQFKNYVSAIQALQIPSTSVEPQQYEESGNQKRL